MRGFGKKKYWIQHTVLVITIITGLVFVSGCSNVSLGSTQVADFGNSKDSEQVQNCFIEKYGNPATYSGPPRFIEPMVSDGIVNNTPANKVSKFSRDTPRVYIWAFYEGFKPGDQVTAVWTFNGQQFASLSKQVGGNYGIVSGQFDKPTSGWAVGTHTIMISGNGVQDFVTFDIVEGATVTKPLPCSQDAGQINEEEGKTKVVNYNGPPPREILSYIADKTKTLGVVKIPTPATGTQYEVYVHTGEEAGAGTDADVWITIFADGGKTEQIHLDNADDNFERGKVDDFYFFSSDIGELREINLSISCFEHCSLWALGSIFVVNTRTNQAWIFPYNHEIQPHEKWYYYLIPGYRWTEWPYDTDSPAPAPTPQQGSMTPPPPTSPTPVAPTTTPPQVVHLPTTTPTIVYACWTQPQVLTPTLIISLNPTTTPTTVPTTPNVVILNTTPATPIPKYKGYSI